MSKSWWLKKTFKWYHCQDETRKTKIIEWSHKESDGQLISGRYGAQQKDLEKWTEQTAPSCSLTCYNILVYYQIQYIHTKLYFNFWGFHGHFPYWYMLGLLMGYTLHNTRVFLGIDSLTSLVVYSSSEGVMWHTRQNIRLFQIRS